MLCFLSVRVYFLQSPLVFCLGTQMVLVIPVRFLLVLFRRRKRFTKLRREEIFRLQRGACIGSYRWKRVFRANHNNWTFSGVLGVNRAGRVGVFPLQVVVGDAQRHPFLRIVRGRFGAIFEWVSRVSQEGADDWTWNCAVRFTLHHSQNFISETGYVLLQFLWWLKNKD